MKHKWQYVLAAIILLWAIAATVCLSMLWLRDRRERLNSPKTISFIVKDGGFFTAGAPCTDAFTEKSYQITIPTDTKEK